MFSHLVPKPEPAYHSGHEPAETTRAITKLNSVYFVCVCVCERERESLMQCGTFGSSHAVRWSTEVTNLS